MIVKICGITRPEDAVVSIEAGADMLGFNFYRPSPRYLEPEDAGLICTWLREELGDMCPILVGVFANESVSNISRTLNVANLDFAQLSGDESDEMLMELRGRGFKAIRPANLAQAMEDVAYFERTFPPSEFAPSLVLDAYHPKLYGGTGEQASTEIALKVRAEVPRLMLAGGLNPDNVAERVRAVHPWGVDVASGVEVDGQPGIKDPEKVWAFVETAKIFEV